MTPRQGLPHGEVRLEIDTDYPSEGTVRITVAEAPDAWTLTVRVPQWALGATLDGIKVPTGSVSIAGPKAGTQLLLELPVIPRWSWPDPRIDAVRGQVAVERGPLVYCLESVDLGVELDGLAADPSVDLVDTADGIEVTLIERDPEPSDWPYGTAPADGGRPRVTQLHPYYDWGNRGATTMRVWVPASS